VSAPRLEIDLDRIETNARTLVGRLGARGIRVTGVTKATLGSPEVGRALLEAGVRGLGDAGMVNIETLLRAGLTASMTLLRSPMPSQAARVVQHADLSLNTELAAIRRLSAAAVDARRIHRVILMVEMGDLREGLMPGEVLDVARETFRLPNVQLAGIGTNLACRSGVVPDEKNMAELSALVESIQSALAVRLDVVSGGNSANLAWALGESEVGRINELRLGESILLGREPLHREAIDGLHVDAFTLVAEVIESKLKPSRPWGEVAQSAFGAPPSSTDRGDVEQAILAIGRQDVDPDGVSVPTGMQLLGASSDHLIVQPGRARLPVGAEVRLGLNYSALVRAMTSPFVEKVMLPRGGSQALARHRRAEKVATSPFTTTVGARRHA
jgi:predicted amino acid racemase